MMFRTRSTVDAATRIDARHLAEIKAWWRDWRRYLQAHLQLLHTRQAEATLAPSFERTDQAWEQQRTEAEHTLKRIPHDRRVVFDRARDARRADIQAQLEGKQQANGAAPRGGLDPDVVERETLQRLIDQAQGAGDEAERWGEVPLPNGWYELEVGALLHAPAAAEYAVVLADVDDRRKHIALVAGLLLVALVMVWWTWPRRSTAASPPPVTDLAVNGQAAQPWPVMSVTALDVRGGRTSLLVTATTGLHWPTAPGAWWRSTAVMPLELCMPVAVLASAQTLELQSSGDAPGRTYILLPAHVARPDLRVVPCGSAEERAARHGMLDAVTPRASQPLQTPVQIGAHGPELRVDGVSVLGAGQDPQLPSDIYRVIVHVAPLTTVTWTSLDPRLVLQTGLDTIPSAPVSASEGQHSMVDVVYLVPAFSRPLAAAWQVTDPDTKRQARWQISLDPPQSRADVVRASFELTATAERGAGVDTATVTLVARNVSGATVALTNADLKLTQGDRVLPVTALGAEGITVKPREVRTLTLPLHGIDLTQAFSVRVGAAGFRLRF